MVKRFIASLPLLALVLPLAGCEQTRPPTPEGLKLIAARTATGTKNTKLETKIQPDTPVAGQVSIWEFKVYDIHDKPDKTRQEWKFFNPLPQSSNDKATTEVEMNAWLISKDGKVFLPQKPLYKQYGTFLTDWTIPTSGPYTLWVEYQPVIAKDELSFNDLKKAPILPVEHARWDVAATGTTSTKALVSEQQGSNYAVYRLDASDYAERSNMTLKLASVQATSGQETVFSPTIAPVSGELSDEAMVALSPDGKTLLHAVGAQPKATFPQKGKWRAWYSFSVDGKDYACPFDINVT